MWSWGCDYSFFHECYYFGLYACFLLLHIKECEVSVSLILLVSLFLILCLSHSSVLHYRRKPQRECTFQPFSSSPLSLFSFVLSSTIPSTKSWGTTMLVINFLIPFISLSPPPLPPPAHCHLLLALRLSPPLSPSRTPFVCFNLISILPLLQTAGKFSTPTHLHTSLSQYIILSPVPHCSMVPVTPVSVPIWSSRDHSTARQHLTTEHEGIFIQIKEVELQISWCVDMCGTDFL